MLRLDYISCVLTIASTILVGRKRWEGWVVASANSVLICIIGVNTWQLGFIPANLFCIALYAHNILEWRKNNPGQKRHDQPCAEPKSLAI
ncbi:MAG TPA: hypothetical protein VE866_02335 [Candidatus Binatia bacterium]|nr:hypothetical protein [Candidatus Binatia bacterium]